MRDLAAIESILDSGADYAMLGTAAIRDDAFRRAALAAFGDRIVLCLDARDGMLAVAGWTSVSTVAAIDFAASLADLPPAAVVFTDNRRRRHAARRQRARDGAHRPRRALSGVRFGRGRRARRF